MKTFIVIVTIALFAGALALTDEQKAKGIQNARQCGDQYGVPLNERIKLMIGDFANYNSEKHQCFVQCFLENGGFIKGGELQENVVFEKLSGTIDGDKIQSVINICKNERGANDCETAFRKAECCYKNKAALH